MRLTSVALTLAAICVTAPAAQTYPERPIRLVVAFAAHVSGGKMKALSVTSAKRMALLPNVPTIAESAIDGFDFEIWHGLFAPAHTPEKIVRALQRHVAAIAETPQIRDRLITQGFEVVASTPERFAALLAREIPKYRKIVADAGIALE